MGTSYAPPTEEPSPPQQAAVPQKQNKGPSDAATVRMLRTLEEEMTKGRRGGVDDPSLDQAMFEIAQMSSNMVKTRKEMMSQAAQQEADPSSAPEETKVPEKAGGKTGETGKQRR
jgi:hypothetical protein